MTSNVQFRFTDQLGDVLGDVRDSMLVGNLFFAKDSLDGILLRHRNVLTDVLVSFLVVAQVDHHSIIGGQHDQQLRLGSVHDFQLSVVFRLIVERANHMDCQILFTAKRPIIQFTCVSEVLFVGCIAELL